MSMNGPSQGAAAGPSGRSGGQDGSANFSRQLTSWLPPSGFVSPADYASNMAKVAQMREALVHFEKQNELGLQMYQGQERQLMEQIEAGKQAERALAQLSSSAVRSTSMQQVEPGSRGQQYSSTAPQASSVPTPTAAYTNHAYVQQPTTQTQSSYYRNYTTPIQAPTVLSVPQHQPYYTQNGQSVQAPVTSAHPQQGFQPTRRYAWQPQYVSQAQTTQAAAPAANQHIPASYHQNQSLQGHQTFPNAQPQCPVAAPRPPQMQRAAASAPVVPPIVTQASSSMPAASAASPQASPQTPYYTPQSVQFPPSSTATSEMPPLAWTTDPNALTLVKAIVSDFARTRISKPMLKDIVNDTLEYMRLILFPTGLPANQHIPEVSGHWNASQKSAITSASHDLASKLAPLPKAAILFTLRYLHSFADGKVSEIATPAQTAASAASPAGTSSTPVPTPAADHPTSATARELRENLPTTTPQPPAVPIAPTISHNTRIPQQPSSAAAGPSQSNPRIQPTPSTPPSTQISPGPQVSHLDKRWTPAMVDRSRIARDILRSLGGSPLASQTPSSSSKGKDKANNVEASNLEKEQGSEPLSQNPLPQVPPPTASFQSVLHSNLSTPPIAVLPEIPESTENVTSVDELKEEEVDQLLEEDIVDYTEIKTPGAIQLEEEEAVEAQNEVVKATTFITPSHLDGSFVLIPPSISSIPSMSSSPPSSKPPSSHVSATSDEGYPLTTIVSPPLFSPPVETSEPEVEKLLSQSQIPVPKLPNVSTLSPFAPSTFGSLLQAPLANQGPSSSSSSRWTTPPREPMAPRRNSETPLFLPSNSDDDIDAQAFEPGGDTGREDVGAGEEDEDAVLVLKTKSPSKAAQKSRIVSVSDDEDEGGGIGGVGDGDNRGDVFGGGSGSGRQWAVAGGGGRGAGLGDVQTQLPPSSSTPFIRSTAIASGSGQNDSSGGKYSESGERGTRKTKGKKASTSTTGMKMLYVAVPALPTWAAKIKAREEKRAGKRRVVGPDVEMRSERSGPGPLQAVPERSRKYTEQETRETSDLAWSRFRTSRCGWEECKVSRYSAQHLAAHTVSHAKELEAVEGPISCLWRDCTRGFHTLGAFEMHLQNHALFPIRCPYKGCFERFDTQQRLAQHLDSQRHAKDVLYPRPTLEAPQPVELAPPPPTCLKSAGVDIPPNFYPAYVCTSVQVRQPAMHRQLHDWLGAKIATNLRCRTRGGKRSKAGVPSRSSRRLSEKIAVVEATMERDPGLIKSPSIAQILEHQERQEQEDRQKNDEQDEYEPWRVARQKRGVKPFSSLPCQEVNEVLCLPGFFLEGYSEREADAELAAALAGLVGWSDADGEYEMDIDLEGQGDEGKGKGKAREKDVSWPEVEESERVSGLPLPEVDARGGGSEMLVDAALDGGVLGSANRMGTNI